MKLLIIGIDGATFDLILPWVEAGHLPNLARLIQGGVRANLASTLPPVTSPAWPTFMTGCNPGKHGVFDFIQPAGLNFSLVNSTKIRQPTLWQRLSRGGYKVGVLNVPVTYPPQPVNGFMITGILSPKGSHICYPADLIERYKAGLGDYRVGPNIQYKPGIEAEYIADIYALIRTHGDWALQLMAEEPWDMLMVHFIALDIMMHALWRFMDRTHPRYEPSPYEHAIRDGYKLVDEYIGRMLDRLPPDSSVLVMSDHGFGPLRNIVNLNVFLMQKGLLKLKRDPWTQLKATAFRLGLTPAGVYHRVEQLGLQNLAARVSKDTRNRVVGKFLSFDNVDWSQTVAYSMGHVGQIYLNMAGREPYGIVTEATYQQTLQEVIAALQTLQDAGRPLVSRIILRRETYHGPYTDQGPDIHLVLDDYNMIAFPLFATDGKVITSQIRGDSGCHRREGVFIGCGPAIKQGERLAEANILDLAPTVMHLFGLPVPRIMDGQVLQEMFPTPAEVSYSDEDDAEDVRASQALSAEETAQVEERLRSLGYL
ncbi:MAG: alkaline phosphatase family protein [Chloroflexi bacterium]|nr:alkaline phosphatase family protein [Chloroflexota bacterium]MCI0574662.1 alkaline phosphatase family protein [Chloroflexota bacterium]MCI0649056.1 alkaline phosphatase family protein [Chloroflexota bacterium]MCI0725151.1 alkaline phosphatase family protein [Chloroflexota bacterium]